MRSSASGCRHGLAAGLVLVLLASEARSERPAFSLDEIVQVRSIGQVVLSPDRRTVAFTAVGRYFGHPLFPAFGEDSNLHVLSLADGSREQVTSGPHPKTYPRFSPDGRALAYESEGDLWKVDLASGARSRLTTHVSADRSAAWSPDGRSIAFVSSRWGRNDIWVMDAAGERVALRRVTDDEFGEATPVWSPDGSRLLFVSSRDEHFYSRAIYDVPVAGGAVRRLTPDDDARNNWPVFSPDGTRVAYVSDRSGYLNLWTMAPDGSDHRQVTRIAQDQDYPENDYIQTMGLHWSPEGRELLHFTNRDGNLDLMTVDVVSGRSRVLEATGGSHHPVGWSGDGGFVYVFEDYRTPPDIYVRPRGGQPRRLTWSGRPVFRPEHFDRMARVRWTSPDGVVVQGYLRTPSWLRDDDRLPAIVVSHTYNVGQFYNQWNPIFSYLAQAGYVLLMVDHRGSNGYGVAFRDLPKGNWGFAQLTDIESAAAHLRSLPFVDGERVGMLGYSMGGYLTLLAATTRPGVFRAAVCVFGLGEITGDPLRSSKNYVWHLGGTEAQIPEAYRKASPVTHVAQVRAPVLIIHSDGDPIEPVTKVHNFVQAMERHGKRVEVRIYPNEAHGLRDLGHQRDSFERVMDFLDRHLR